MLLVLLATCLASSEQSPSRAEALSENVELRCGEYCLFVALRALDIDVPTVESLEQALGQPGTIGYSMEQLALAAEAFGAHTLGVQTSLKHLERRRGHSPASHCWRIQSILFASTTLTARPFKLSILPNREWSPAMRLPSCGLARHC